MNEEELVRAKEKFIEIQNLFKRMSHEEMCVVIESYYIWRTLVFSRSITEIGKEVAEKNAKLMSLYKEFFLPTEQSHFHVFITGLLKFFDRDTQALSFNKLINKIQANKNSFTKEILESVHPHLKEMGFVKDNYSPIIQEDIDHFEGLISKHKDLIENLKDIRDKQLAHTDLKAHNGTFVPNEVEELIQAIQEIFNKFTKTFDQSSTIWNHLKEDSVRSTNFLMENLERGEKVRLEEIRKKWELYE